MNRLFGFFLFLGMTLTVLCGCQRLRPLVPPDPHWKPVFEEPAPVAKMPQEVPKNPDPLVYFNYIQSMTDSEQQKEFKNVKSRFAKSEDEEDRWRLIFLSLLPGQPFSDPDYALELLRGRKKGKDPTTDFRTGLGNLLSPLLADQNKLRNRLSEETQRAEKLAQQLRELKEIETILGEREKGRPASVQE